MPDTTADPYVIPTHSVSSSNIHAVGYDDEKQILAIEFKSGEVFHYAGVTADQALDLINAPSVGRYYHAHIKGKKPGQKMTGPCPNCGWTGRVGALCSDCGTGYHVDTPRPEGATDGRETEDSASASGGADGEGLLDV